MNNTRIEHDAFGPIEVPAQYYWGAQTQRALEYFAIGSETLPSALISALGAVKYCAAKANMQLGTLEPELGNAIAAAARRVFDGELDQHFPIAVWQTGSGTQSNMNANEVIANLTNQMLGHKMGQKSPVHPNDHCNLSQSSNDSFPSAMHIATVEQTHRKLLPALNTLRQTLTNKSAQWQDIIKIGRTHLQDATPITLGQEFSGYAAQIEHGVERIQDSLKRLYPLAQGGTAVGTGLNSPEGFGAQFAREMADLTGYPFTSAANKFAAIASHDAIVEMSGSLNTLAVSLHKIANDIRLLGSGPRSGLSELILPANEPGSSIMPGKVNPTQCEALTMVCAQIFGNHNTITFAGSQGQLELNVFKPVMAFNTLQSISLLSDAATSFERHCVIGISPNLPRIASLMEQSLMLVTALTPLIGYDRASQLAKRAHEKNRSLREEALASGDVSSEEFDHWVRPEQMISPKQSSD